MARKKSQIQKNKERSFKRFVKNNPDLSANDLLKKYRSKTYKGVKKTIGNEKGKDLVRDIRGLEKNIEKITRIKYWGLDDYPIGDQIRKRYIKNRYIYLMRYEVEAMSIEDGEEAADSFIDYLHIAVNRKLTMIELSDETRVAFQKGQKFGEEKYNFLRILPGSIVMLYAVDTKKDSVRDKPEG